MTELGNPAQAERSYAADSLVAEARRRRNLNK
jgi:hypothetical protein